MLNYWKQQRLCPREQTGFTFIEVLLSLALISVILGIGLPIYYNFQSASDINTSATTVARSLRRAQGLSRAVEGDSGWGTYVATGTIVIFKGASFAVRDSDYDENFDLSNSITPSGLSEIIFSKLYGLPLVPGTFILTSSTNIVRNITVNSYGTVDY